MRERLRARAGATFVLALAAALGAVACLGFHQGPMPGEPRKASYASVAGARVRYVDRGTGPAVVLLHGFASALETWQDVIPDLERRHRVLALDLKGFGWTDRPEGDYSPAAQARLVLDLMAERGIERAAVVAHSWGAAVALALALAAPARVTRLALYDAWIYEEQLPTTFLWSRTGGVGEILFGLFYEERADEKIALAFYDRGLVSESLVEDIDRAFARPGTKAAALAAVRGQRFADVQDRYRSIALPALLLWGREDRVAPLGYGERLARDLRRSRLAVYPRCGHFPMIEARAASTADLVAFLDEEGGK
ncbi:MAG: alpha/beta fold hydrolase [Deltaproteobacteria bacterium]|nr:alpha/beta fold hydrolase [Deltaproteobacteria bacterium]